MILLQSSESTDIPFSGGSADCLCATEACSNKGVVATAQGINISFCLFSLRVADKLPRPNLVLLKHLLSVLHRISQNADTNRMDANNLAICVGPNMLSPGTGSMLPLEVQKEMNDKVSGLTYQLLSLSSSDPPSGIPLFLQRPHKRKQHC